MIIIGIDPSLNSTAITIYKNNNFSLFNYTNKKSNYKWIKEIDSMVNFKFHEFIDNDDFSESETEKIKIYDLITDNIVNDIEQQIDQETKVFIEGYSYSSAQGRLIDLVVFGTLIRYKLFKNPNITLYIIPPATLKKTISKYVYQVDKKGIARNEKGKAGGVFDKKDMMECLMKLDLDNNYLEYIKNNSEILLKPKNIPKPFDDVNDSFLLCYFGIKN